jgi:chromosome partitioning protein
MATVLAVVNQKGGVGKTTTTVNLAAALGAANKSCLLVDMDPQGNATSGVGVDKRQVTVSTYEMLINGEAAASALRHTPFKGLDLIPASIQLAGAEIELVLALSERQRRMLLAGGALNLVRLEG